MFFGCKTFRESFDNAHRTFAVAIIPDTCDIFLVEEISTFRIDSQKFPNNQDIERLKEKLNLACRNSIDSIGSMAYNKDSMDFVFQKNLNDSNLIMNSMIKCYRLIFADDTLKEVRIIHHNTKFKSELLEK